MKIKITIIIVLFNQFSVFSQQDVMKEFAKQAVAIDSLKKVIKIEKENYKILVDSLTKKEESIKSLKSILSKLNEFNRDKKKIEALILQKTDSIIKLKKEKSELSLKISNDRITWEQKILDEKEKTKSEILTKIANTYKNKNFDDLIVSSNKLSIQRDLQLLGENNELKQILMDLNKYFEAKSLLDKPFDVEQKNIFLVELNKIKQQSALLVKLKENLDNYQLLDKGLKDCLNSITALDKKATVSGMGKEIQQKKLNKILTEITNYIFNYDLYSNDYPYLSNILFELVKTKVPNPDQDITGLLKK